MTELREYWKSLNFEYLKTYSGLRGEKFEKFKEENEIKIKQLKEELKTARFMQQPRINAKIQELQNETNLHNSRIIDKNEILHPSTIEVSKLNRNSSFANSLDRILNQKCNMEIATGCIPIFRDTLVFFSAKDEIVGILQICFECASIRNENEETLKVDIDIYPKLKSLLRKIGHQID